MSEGAFQATAVLVHALAPAVFAGYLASALRSPIGNADGLTRCGAHRAAGVALGGRFRWRPCIAGMHEFKAEAHKGKVTAIAVGAFLQRLVFYLAHGGTLYRVPGHCPFVRRCVRGKRPIRRTKLPTRARRAAVGNATVARSTSRSLRL